MYAFILKHKKAIACIILILLIGSSCFLLGRRTALHDNGDTINGIRGNIQSAQEQQQSIEKGLGNISSGIDEISASVGRAEEANNNASDASNRIEDLIERGEEILGQIRGQEK